MGNGRQKLPDVVSCETAVGDALCDKIECGSWCPKREAEGNADNQANAKSHPAETFFPDEILIAG